MSETHYTRDTAPETVDQVVAGDTLAGLIERKAEVSQSLTQRRKRVSGLEIEAEQANDPADTLESIKIESEQISEEERRLKGLEGAITMAQSDENIAGLKAVIEHKIAGLNRAADLVDEQRGEYQKIEKCTLKLAEAIKRATDLQKEIFSIVTSATNKRVNGRYVNEGPGSGVGTHSDTEKLVESIDGHLTAARGIVDSRRRPGPLAEERVKQCREYAGALRHFDTTRFSEHDKLEELAEAARHEAGTD